MAQAGSTAGGWPGTRSTVERYFEISLYLMIVTGFATLAGTGKLDLLSVLVVLVALALRGYLLLQDRTVVIPERWTSYIAIFYALFYVVDFLLLSGSFVTATTHLVLWILVVKLFSVHRNRDIVWLCVLAFLSVLAAAVLTVDTLFLAAFALFLLLAVTTFTSWEMKRSAAAAAGRAREAEAGKRRMAWSLSTTAAMLMVSILLGAAGIFFVLPRVTGGYLSQYAPRNQLVSGFSDDVRLGEIGEIQQSSQVVMRIEIEGDTQGNHDLMWRGVALASFDGRRWFNPPHQLTLWMQQQGRYDLEAAARATRSEAATVVTAPRLIHYRVVMEPVDTNVFFLAPVARELIGSYRSIALDKAGTVYNHDRFRPVTYYAASSDIARPGADTLRAAEGAAPDDVLQQYLALPALDPRIRDLAEQATTGAGTNYDRAALIENYLKTRFGYTLQLPGTPPADPLAHFLFERRQGHCEYFASAMTVMLRALGVPARIVNGFRGGEFNDVTGSYIIRARDAHSWVEAYFPGQGWVSFDPTPAGDRPQPGAWQRFLLYVDAAREFWREWVINYDFTHQNQLGSTMLEASRRRRLDTLKWIRDRYRLLVRAAQETQRRAKESPQEWGLGAVATLAGLLVLVNSRRLWRGWRNRRTAARPERAPQAAASIWYERLLKRLARRGWSKRPTQTPEEFVTTLADPLLQEQVARFTQHYERARFGESSEDAKKLPELYEEITASR